MTTRHQVNVYLRSPGLLGAHCKMPKAAATMSETRAAGLGMRVQHVCVLWCLLRCSKCA